MLFIRLLLGKATADHRITQADAQSIVMSGTSKVASNGDSEELRKTEHCNTSQTYSASVPDPQHSLTPTPKRVTESRCTGQRPVELREIDLKALSYVPLPRAPMRWEETQAGREAAPIAEARGLFEVRDANWRIARVDNMPPSERPDTAFRKVAPASSGLVMIDDLGKAEGLGPIEAAVLRYDRTGQLIAKRGLRHGIYRYGVHPFSSNLIAMSRECVVHAYDDQIESIWETSLKQAPEIQAIRKRFEIPDDQLKNLIRCVALSQDGGRYLFTAVDEAWCVDTGGAGVWGAKLPFKEGWTRVTAPSKKSAISDEVHRALAFLGLTLPVSPQDVKRRYRELAKQWHPDLHPENPQSHEMMGRINAAVETLTGIEASAIPQYAGATFVNELSRTAFTVGGITFTASIGMQVSESCACDWIYAASFAAGSNAVYLAGYSGRVVLVDENGEGVRAYDIGSVPRRIIDTGSYLYLLTDTRLYVLHDDVLHALVDTFDGGDLVVAQTGFGLLEKKRLRWFRENGEYLGSVVSKDPIRRVYSKQDGMVIETRQRRAVIQGAPAWWK